ncbi:MAG: hypothetical protein Q7S56_03665 [Nanoarchaeota archaeon]|nr:hypothetical protein [Nanoarchaeota archaeon]
MKNKRGVIAISEILILILGIISIGYAFGSEVGFVSGDETKPTITQGLNIGDQSEEGQWAWNGNQWIQTVTDQSPSSGSGSGGGGISALSVPAATYTLSQYNKIAIQEAGLSEAIKDVSGKDITKVFFDPKTPTKVFSDSALKNQITLPEGVSVVDPKSITPTATPASSGGFLSSIYGLKNWWAAATWGLSVYAGIYLLGTLLGFDSAKVNAAAAAGGLGIASGIGVYQLTQSATWGWVVGGGVAIAVYLLMYKSSSTKIVSFECKPWDAPVGGNDCEKCNAGILPCSEYQCRALGQACKLVNSNSANPLCVNAYKGDVKQPVITTFNEALLPDYIYTPDNTISPPDSGVKIQYQNSKDGCVPAYTPLSFGIKTDEPSLCKIDYVRKQNMTSMQFFFGGLNLFAYNHTQILSLPGPNATESGLPVLDNGGNFNLYVKCTDAIGNENTANFLFRFCVDKGPDTTPPRIVTTNLINGMPVAYNQTSVNIEAYTNEPASCKWSRRDQAYSDMETTMSCASSAFEMNAQMLYKCTTTLDGIKAQSDNDYFFKCEDQPKAPQNQRNFMQQSYKFTIKGTQPLYINALKVNGNETATTIKDSTTPVKVTISADTSAGANEGQAQCYLSDTGDEGSYIEFGNTNNVNAHSEQDLYLASGSYTYYIKCVDLGGNSDTKTISFKVETDTTAPIVARAYHNQNDLEIITTEEANCVYDVKDCKYTFADGIKIDSTNDIQHFTPWTTGKTYYIKCQDAFKNAPSPDQCSIIVTPAITTN